MTLARARAATMSVTPVPSSRGPRVATADRGARLKAEAEEQRLLESLERIDLRIHTTYEVRVSA